MKSGGTPGKDTPVDYTGTLYYGSCVLLGAGTGLLTDTGPAPTMVLLGIAGLLHALSRYGEIQENKKKEEAL